MSWYKVFIPPRITGLVATEAIHSPLDSPDADLTGEVGVDLLNDVFLFDDQLEGDHIARSMNSFIRSSTSHEL